LCFFVLTLIVSIRYEMVIFINTKTFKKKTVIKEADLTA
jgi:hypothetical protein